MKLTKVQQAVLDAIKAHGYIRSIAWHCSSTTSVPGYPHRVTDATLKALRHAKVITTQVIAPRGGRYPDGTTNDYKVSTIIYVPTLEPGHYVEIMELETGHVVKRMGPHSQPEAERIERGVSINLNHDKFVTHLKLVACRP